MPTRTERWPAGTPSWVDLGVPDVEQAKEFYAALLGWDYREAGGGYWICTYGGYAAAGLMTSQSEGPPAWNVYLASDDVEADAKGIEDAGGHLEIAPSTIAPWGSMLWASDPTGARFGLWQGADLSGVTIVNEPGSLTWEDLMTTDLEAAKSFYADVFHFRYEDMGGEGDYATFGTGGDPLGGIGRVLGDERPGWRAYFAVADADLAVAAAQGRGAAVLEPCVDTPYGRMARIADPFGAELSLMGTVAA